MALNLPLVLPITGLARNSDVKINLDFILAQFEALDGGTSTWDSVAIGTPGVATGTLILYNSSNSNSTTIQAGAAAANIVFTLPTTDGTANQVLTTDGSGVLSWQSASGANTALSNLASTAVNTNLLPDGNLTRNLGGGSFEWSTVVTQRILHSDTASDLVIETGVGSGKSIRISPDTGGTVQVTKQLSLSSGTELQFAGASRNVNIAATEPASASRTYTIPDGGGNVSFVLTGGTQTISGTKTFDGQLIGKGTATNDNASTGYIGEYVEALQSSLTNFPTSGQTGNNISISLTAGDWDISLIIYAVSNGATVDRVFTGVGTASGNSFTGVITGVNSTEVPPPNAVSSTGGGVPSYRVSIASTTTYYLKVYSEYTVATPQYQGRISARRVR